ncbi:MAG: hypothetical protein U1E29_11245 [Coriobacteriia bacterium]|nr:hypothetical protein [Coriobacteriia bacterium]
MLSRNDKKAIAAAAAWTALWSVIGIIILLVGEPNVIERDNIVFAWRMGLFIGAVVGAFGSTESRSSKAQNSFVVGAMLIASAMPLYLPGQTDRGQWAFNLVAIGIGAITAFPSARVAAAFIRKARAGAADKVSGTEGDSRD